MSYISLKYSFFLSLLLYGYTVAAVNPADTLNAGRLLLKGISLKSSDPDSAILCYEAIISQYRSQTNAIARSPDPLESSYLEMVIRAHNALGNLYYFRDEYKRAETYFQESKQISGKYGFMEFNAQALYDIGYCRYVTNDFIAATDLFSESFSLYASAKNTYGMYDAVQAAGLTHRRLGNNLKSDSCYQVAFQIATALNDSNLIADTRMNHGILLCELGDLETGLLYFEEALHTYESAGEQKAVSLALLNIGVVLKMIGEFEKALGYIRRSAQIEEALKQKSQLVARYYNLADLYLEMGQNELAYEYCLRTDAVANEIGSKPFLAECGFLKGKYHYLAQRYAEAEQTFQSAWITASSSNSKPLMGNILLWRAKNSLAEGNAAMALYYGLQADSLARTLQMLAMQKESARLLSEVYERTGNYHKALRWYKLYTTWSDSLDYDRQHREMSRIEARFNYEKKERENQLLRNEASLQSQKLKNRNLQALALAIVAILGLVIILLLIRRSRDARLLFRQQQMLTVKHLHELEDELDGKNRELTSKMMFLNQKNEMISRMIERLQMIRDHSESSNDEIISLVNELRSDAPQSNWKEFEAQFIQVHPGFYRKLYSQHPELTSNEQRICAFLRMNLNTKEISSITGRSVKSIEVTRSRIRTKLNLHRNENLSSYLAGI